MILAKLRLWYWWLVRCLNIIHFRRRVVAGTTVLCVLWACLATMMIPPVYSSRAIVRPEGDDVQLQESKAKAEANATNMGNVSY